MLVDGRDDVDDRTVEPGRVILNHHVPSIKKAAARLDELGARWVSRVEYRDAGLWFGTVEDPDGNYVQLIETTPEYWKLKSRARRRGRRPPESTPAPPSACPPRTSSAPDAGTPRSLGLDAGRGARRRPPLRAAATPSSSSSPPPARRPATTPRWASPSPTSTSPSTQLRQRGVEFDGDIVDVEGHYPSTGASRRARHLVQRQRGQPDRAGGVRLLIVEVLRHSRR